MLSYRDILWNEFQMRKKRNKSYSLRAFSRDLSMPASKLSQALNGICGISPERAKNLSKKLNFEAKETHLFVTMVRSEHSRSKKDRDKAQQILLKLERENKLELTFDQYKVVQDWVYFAVYNLLQGDSNREKSVAWIAKRLAITVSASKEALKILESVGLVTKIPNGNFVAQKKDVTTSFDVPSNVIREHHRQIMTKGASALDECEVELREFLSLMFVSDGDKIKEMKEFLRSSVREFENKFTDKSNENVYALSVQLFPITKKEIL